MQRLAYGLFASLSFGVAAYAAVAYGMLPLGVLVHPDMTASFELHATAVYTHVFAALVALVLGPLQFSRRLRTRRPRVHRAIGRIYLLVGVLVGGLAGLYIARFAFGGLLSQSGFAVLAVLWLFSGARALMAIRAGKVALHRAWMVRNMSLTFAAVTLRIYLGLFTAAGLAFESFYPFLGWLCWVPNLLLAELLFNRPPAHRAAAA